MSCRKIDMTGWVMKEHGVPDSKITVLYELPERKNKQIIWHCKCECGTEWDVVGVLLRNGNTKSCGCSRDEKRIDMTGWIMKEHGVPDSRLTILYKMPKKEDKKIYWYCKCECGNEFEARGDSLRNGSIKSCGCLHKDIASELGRSHLKIFPKGTRFGKLTILERANNKNELVMWQCQCDCGNICEVRSKNLISGITQSCGCLKKEIGDRSLKIIPKGTRFGKLTVLKLLDERQNGKTVYQCQCDCGNLKNVNRASLISGNTQSCGCLISKGEFKISQILKENNITFEQQKIFEDCKFLDTNNYAKFDFYVNNKYIIEFDGEQHFKIGGWATKEKVEYTQNHDEYKNQYCKINNIPIIRIPYTHLKDLCLEDLLLNKSKFLVE